MPRPGTGFATGALRGLMDGPAHLGGGGSNPDRLPGGKITYLIYEQ
ncbi:uncharacterized protein METZ01_LOCUS318560 [marine metagenome]|uniref:Uncharacterized protein n=1 Tax=marine metagenome TaxID=408172 RepID=A0A382NXB5_9ZZZZ